MIGTQNARLVRHIELDFVFDRSRVLLGESQERWLDAEVIASFMRNLIAKSHEESIPKLTVSCTHESDFHYKDDNCYYLTYEFVGTDKRSFVLDLEVKGYREETRLIWSNIPLLLRLFQKLERLERLAS